MSNGTPGHGGQLRQISERFGIAISRLTDFSANINPDGPSPAVLSTLRECLDDSLTLTAYPDLEEAELRRSIAIYAGVSADNIAVANGFVPLLEAALRSRNVRRCLLPVPAFVEYRRSLERLGVQITPHLLDPQEDFRYDMDALLEGGHDAILLANPQNPSGSLTSYEELLRLVAISRERDITVLLDEAFIDYAPAESLTGNTREHANLIVFRSVTKFHGVPGLRVAYAAASDHTARSLRDSLPPWPITTLASLAIIASLGDRDYETRTRLHNNARRSQLREGIAALGLHVYPSAANFLLLRLPETSDASDLWRQMILEQHLVLRDCSNYEALPPGHLRIAVRSELDNELLLQALRAMRL